jgi:hypothetical protein
MFLSFFNFQITRIFFTTLYMQIYNIGIVTREAIELERHSDDMFFNAVWSSFLNGRPQGIMTINFFCIILI